MGFRLFVRSRATELHLGGSVKNMPDRSVRVEAQGPRGALLELLADLHKGPPAARVERVDVEWISPQSVADHFFEAG